jgi:hypothetical protein
VDLRDANFVVNVTNIVAAAIYVGAGAVPFINGDVQAQQGSGRLLLSHPVVRAVTQAADFLYLACAVACIVAHGQDAADAAAADGLAAQKPPGIASPTAAAAQPDGPPFDVFQPLLSLCRWRALAGAKAPAARGAAAASAHLRARPSVRASARALHAADTPERARVEPPQTPARASAMRATLERGEPPDTAVRNPLAAAVR